MRHRRADSGHRSRMIAALPTLIVFFVLRRQFVAGLALGATKG